MAVLKRLEWARQTKGMDWRRAIFPDESSFELGKDINETRVIRSLAEAEAFKKQHLKIVFRVGRQSIMVWGRIGRNLKLPLVRLGFSTREGIHSKGLTGQRYIDQGLGPHLGVDFATLCGRDLCSSKTTPLHTIHVRQTNYELSCRFQAQHPPRSPDLNPIEHMWAMTKRAVGKTRPRPTTVDALWDAVRMAWDEIPMGKVNTMVLSMVERR